MHLTKVTLHPEKYPPENRYPFNLEIFRRTRSLDFTAPVTFFAGDNGTGKSTLLRALAWRCRVHIWEESGRTRFEHNPCEKLLYRTIDVAWADGPVPGSFFASQSFQHFARVVDEWAAADPAVLEYFGGKSLMVQSHGQSLMSFFRSRYRVEGIYFLDEPETALSPRTQLELLRVLAETSRGGRAQFVIATHSPILLACPGAVIYSFDEIPVRVIEYEDTEHYRVYRDFMADRTPWLRPFEASE